MRSLSMVVSMMLLGGLLIGCGGSGSQDFSTCGNGRVDTGEGCDDGNLADDDACTSACQPARCGDGVVHDGVEECDSRDLNHSDCSIIGRAGALSCDGACQYDYSACRDLPTPTDTPPPRPTPTATPGSVCGDALLGKDESCESCPDDCAAGSCAPGTQSAMILVSVTVPASTVSRLTVSLAFRTTVVDLPDTGLQSRIAPLSNNIVRSTPGQTDYAATIGVVNNNTVSSGPAFTLKFDRCNGAPAPSTADFACTVTQCSPATDCICTASVMP